MLEAKVPGLLAAHATMKDLPVSEKPASINTGGKRVKAKPGTKDRNILFISADELAYRFSLSIAAVAPAHRVPRKRIADQVAAARSVQSRER